MSLRRSHSAFIFALALTACSAPEAGPPDSNAGKPSACNAAAVQHIIGQTVSPAVLDQARSEANAVSVRALGPNDVVTMEFNAQRLNLHTDKNQIVIRVSCG